MKRKQYHSKFTRIVEEYGGDINATFNSLLDKGMKIKEICSYLGISGSTYYRYSHVNEPKTKEIIEKRCAKCKEVKSVSEFYGNNRTISGIDSYCKRCNSILSAIYRKKNKESKNRKNREYYYKNRIERAIYQKKFKYGISDSEIEKMKTIRVCPLCKRNVVFIQDRQGCRGNQLVVDHCHVTGRVRGFICGRCNKVLGELNNGDISYFERIIQYLKVQDFIVSEPLSK